MAPASLSSPQQALSKEHASHEARHNLAVVTATAGTCVAEHQIQFELVPGRRKGGPARCHRRCRRGFVRTAGLLTSCESNVVAVHAFPQFGCNSSCKLINRRCPIAAIVKCVQLRMSFCFCGETGANVACSSSSLVAANSMFANVFHPSTIILGGLRLLFAIPMVATWVCYLRVD